MDATTNVLLDRLRACANVYETITVLFLAATKDENKTLREYSTWLKSPRDDPPQQRIEIEKLTQMLNNSAMYFGAVALLTDFLEQHEDDLMPLIVQMLYSFDGLFSSRPEPHDQVELECCGPKNGWQHRQDTGASFFFTPQSMFQDDFLRINKWYLGRKLESANPAGLAAKLQNYTVVRHDALNGMKPFVRAYYSKGSLRKALDEGTLRAAVFPYGKRKWFDWPRTEDGLAFNILYNNAQETAILDAYLRALQAADRECAEVAIFPEMALGPDALSKLREHLKKTGNQYKHLCLIFLGSRWENSENCAYILTSTGRELLAQKKREPFEWYDKNARMTIRENLADHDKALNMLDVPGLGRISYFICRDFLDPREKLIRTSWLRSRFLVVACYTPETAEFSEKAEDYAKCCAGITLLCNCCEPIEDKKGLSEELEIGFVMTPSSGEEQGAVKKAYKICGPECTKNDCALCACMRVYTLTFSPESPYGFDVGLDVHA